MKFETTCCEAAKQQLELFCEEHLFDCPDQILKFSPAHNTGYVSPDDQKYYPGVDIPDRFLLIGRNATYGVTYCPFCGRNLYLHCEPKK